MSAYGTSILGENYKLLTPVRKDGTIAPWAKLLISLHNHNGVASTLEMGHDVVGEKFYPGYYSSYFSALKLHGYMAYSPSDRKNHITPKGTKLVGDIDTKINSAYKCQIMEVLNEVYQKIDNNKERMSHILTCAVDESTFGQIR